jgi:protein-S-isoprenylcysteine O-methyltransferase Ste14
MMSANENAQAPQSETTRPGGRRCLSRAVAVVYGLVMFEVVIMVSPFAFYFYAAYGPTLKWLNRSTATAWLTGFLLPHAVFTTSPFLEFLRWDLGRYFFGLGLLAFFVLAAQIYGSKLFGRKLVNSGIYRYIRHPQYLGLGLSAFGLFTMWPRMMPTSLEATNVVGWPLDSITSDPATKKSPPSASSSWLLLPLVRPTTDVKLLPSSV